MPYLVARTGTRAGDRLPVEADTVVLGRDGADINVEDKAASRRHAEIFRIGELCFVRDLKSKNGTFLNDSKVEEELLKSGDRIRIGSTVYHFVDEHAAGLADEIRFGEEPAAPEGKREGTTILVGPKDLPDAKAADRQLERLGKAARDLAAVHDREDLFRTSLSALAEAVESDFGYLFLPDEKAGGFRGMAQHGDVRDVSVSRSILRHTLAAGQAVLTEDAASDARFRDQRSVMLRGIHSVLCVPVGKDPRRTGLVYLGRGLMDRPFTAQEARFASLLADMATLALESASVRETQQEIMMTTARTLVRALELRQPGIEGHSERVAAFSLQIARAMGLSFEECRRAQVGGLLHDIGRLASPSDAAPGEAAGDGESLHVYLGERILAKAPGLSEVLPAVSYHHERADGTGFPRGMKGADIPPIGRVVAVANAFDNLLYGAKDGQPGLVKDALLAIREQAGKGFDAEAVRALLLAYRRGTLHETILEREIAAATGGRP